MATDPKKDQNRDIELDEEQLDSVAGGDGSTDPRDTPFPPSKKGDLGASEAP